jgi:hypothetical protein
MNRTSSLTRYAGASAPVLHPRTSLPRPVPGTRLVAVPVLSRAERQELLEQLAADISQGTPPGPLAVAVLVAALASDRLRIADRDCVWHDFITARRRLDDILEASPGWERIMTAEEATAAVSRTLARLLDGHPVPDMAVPRQP